MEKKLGPPPGFSRKLPPEFTTMPATSKTAKKKYQGKSFISTLKWHYGPSGKYFGSVVCEYLPVDRPSRVRISASVRSTVWSEGLGGLTTISKKC